MDLPVEANLWGETTFEEKGREAVASPMLLSAYDLWVTNLRGRTLPSRADFDPVDMPKLLPHIILVDVENPGPRLRVRLSGTNVVNVFGGDYTGQYLDEIDFGDARQKILHDYIFAVDAKRPLFSDHKFRRLSGTYLNIERVILPLSDNDDSVNILMAVLSFFQSLIRRSLPYHGRREPPAPTLRVVPAGYCGRRPRTPDARADR